MTVPIWGELHLMNPIRLLPTAGQVAEHLRGEPERGRTSGKMPRVNWLAAEPGVNREVAEAHLACAFRIVWMASANATPMRANVFAQPR
jgi:hypothetical protein